MEGDRELATWLRGWRAASEQVERALTEACLTAEEISAFVEDQLESEPRARALTHLARCSFCTRQVGSLCQAARGFEDRLRVRRALGELAGRVGACLRVFVDETRGAFTRADALLQELAPPVRLFPAQMPGDLVGASARGVVPEEADDETDAEALHEVTLHSETLPGTELLCGEEDGGCVTVSRSEPCEVRLLGPDGVLHAVAVERGDDRYYATITGMPPGEYLLAILEPGSPSPPGA